MFLETIKDKMLYQKPNCIDRLGEEIFIQLPLYEAKSTFEPIYINDKLFQTLFQKNLSWQKQAELIKKLFSITLDITQSTGEQRGLAFVDKQGEDAYGISLQGNKGSGRAYYTGSCFNIKGEKTPLATSASAYYSNGVFKMGDGIWSALIGNSLYEEFSVKHSPVLAILRVTLERCIIVRIDEDGSLDRITHLFYNPYPLTHHQLKQSATNLGRFEAEKFIHRILHGAWSAGNTSLLGHLIDYDSVRAVKGRQPQFSYSPNFPDNYFGFEYLGQFKILKDICNNPLLNPHHISVTELETVLMTSFNERLSEGLIYLMGFEDHQALYSEFKSLANKLAQTFYELSHYAYHYSTNSLFTNYPSALFFHLFDFSAFFRIYPLLKLNRQFTIALGLSILMGAPLQQTLGAAEHHVLGPEPLPPRIKEPFEKYFLALHDRCNDELHQQINEFLINYDHIFEKMQQVSKTDINEVATRAYVINEDRFYLFPVFSLEPMLLDLQTRVSPQIINRLIQLLIKANQRHPNPDSSNRYIANFRLFEEGFAHLLMDTHGQYQVVINLYREKLPSTVTSEDQWQVVVQNQLVAATSYTRDEWISIESIKLPSSQLSLQYTRDNTFLIHLYELYQQGEKYKLTDYFFPDQDDGYYFS